MESIHEYDPKAPRIDRLTATKTVLPNGARLYVNEEGIPVAYVRWAKRGLRQLIWDGILMVVAKIFRLK